MSPPPSIGLTSSNRPRAGPLPNDAKSGPQGEPMTPIPSASLIILSPPPKVSRSRQNPRDVDDDGTREKVRLGKSRLATLMLQRSARIGSSFRSAVVFPGGALDFADGQYTSGVDLESSSQSTGKVRQEVGDQRDDQVIALQLCALRETFEETGLLLLPSERCQGSTDGQDVVPWSRAVGHREAGLSIEQWKRRREEVHNDASTFVPFLRSIAHKLGISPTSSCPTSNPLPLPHLSYHSHWITPRSVVRPGKRFSAHFFLTVLDLSSSSAQSLANDLSADGTETLSLRLSPPEDLVQEAMQDTLVLYPPQFYILADLAMLGGDHHGHTENKGGDTLSHLSFEERISRLKPLAFTYASHSMSGKSSSIPRNRSSPPPPVPTAVEEEARNLPPGSNYAWDRNTPKKQVTGWVAGKGSTSTSTSGQELDGNRGRPKSRRSITSVEPRALPRLGGTAATGSSSSSASAHSERRAPSTSTAGEVRAKRVWSKAEVAENQEQDPSTSTSISSSYLSTSPPPPPPPPSSSSSFIFPLVLPGDHRASSTSSASSSSTSTLTSSLLPPLRLQRPLNRVYVSPRSPLAGGGLVATGAVRRGLNGLGDWRIGVGLFDEEDEEEEEQGLGQREESRINRRRGKL